MHLDQTTPKTTEKKAPSRRRSDAQSALSFPQALRILEPLETRSRVLDAVKAAGHPPATWGSVESLRTLADAITRAEDWLELQRSTPRRERELATLCALRRPLEVELWP